MSDTQPDPLAAAVQHAYDEWVNEVYNGAGTSFERLFVQHAYDEWANEVYNGAGTSFERLFEHQADAVRAWLRSLPDDEWAEAVGAVTPARKGWVPGDPLYLRLRVGRVPHAGRSGDAR